MSPSDFAGPRKVRTETFTQRRGVFLKCGVSIYTKGVCWWSKSRKFRENFRLSGGIINSYKTRTYAGGETEIRSVCTANSNRMKILGISGASLTRAFRKTARRLCSVFRQLVLDFSGTASVNGRDARKNRFSTHIRPQTSGLRW